MFKNISEKTKLVLSLLLLAVLITIGIILRISNGYHDMFF